MITLHSIKGADESEMSRFNEALNKLNSVWGSQELKALILAAKKLDGSAGFESTDDIPEQVWDKMQSADISIDVTLYDPPFWRRCIHRNNIVGYEDSDGIHINRSFFDTYAAADIADNIAHESMHQIGYSHDFNPTAARPFSVPYQIGEMVCNLLNSEALS